MCGDVSTTGCHGGQEMPAKVLVGPQGRLSHSWGSWQGSPHHGHAAAKASVPLCILRAGQAMAQRVLLAIPNCCSYKVRITQHSRYFQWCGVSAQAEHSHHCRPS